MYLWLYKYDKKIVCVYCEGTCTVCLSRWMMYTVRSWVMLPKRHLECKLECFSENIESFAGKPPLFVSMPKHSFPIQQYSQSLVKIAITQFNLCIQIRIFKSNLDCQFGLMLGVVSGQSLPQFDLLYKYFS